MKIPYDTLPSSKKDRASFHGHPVSRLYTRYLPTNSPPLLFVHTGHYFFFFSLLIFILIYSQRVIMYYRFTKMDEGRQGSIDFSRTDFPFPVLFPFLSSFLFVFCNRSHRWITNERTKRSTKILNLNKSFLVNSSFFLYLVAGLRPFAKH